MKHIVSLLGVLLLVNLAGCCTSEEYVRSQTDPLADRISKLEARVSQLVGMTDADKAAIQQANSKAQQALDVANNTAGGVKNAENDVAKAEAAAMKAEKAAKDAEQSANEARQMATKSEKIFKLEQKK